MSVAPAGRWYTNGEGARENAMAVKTTNTMKARELRQKTLLTVDLQLVVYRSKGSFFVVAPQLDIWDSHAELTAAIEGAIEGIIGALELADEKGHLDSYLTHRGFKKQGKAYCDPQEKSRIADFVGEIEWSKRDPDRGQFSLLRVSAQKCEIIQNFTKPEAALMWQGMIDRERAAHAR